MERIIPDVMKQPQEAASVAPEKTEASENINPMFEQERAAPYGYCPVCASPGKMRERRPDGNDTCEQGHKYASASALTAKPETAAPAPTPKKETSRFENVNEGMCPSCGQQMRLSLANGIPVHVCMEHSVVMPLRDPEPINVL